MTDTRSSAATIDALAKTIWLAGFERAFSRTPTDPWENQAESAKAPHINTARKIIEAGFVTGAVAQAAPNTIAVDEKLLHSLWCYGTLAPVEGVVYSYGTHKKCLDAIDDLIADHVAARESKSAPAAVRESVDSTPRPPASAAMGHSAGADTRCSAGTEAPVAWIAFAANGNIIFWTSDPQRAVAEKQRGLDLRAFTLAELIALVSRIPAQPQTLSTPERGK